MTAFSEVERNYLELTERITTLLGDRPTQTELDAFPYNVFYFVIKSIRDADKDDSIGGTRLMERWFKGIQEIWVRINQRIDDFENTLFDPNLIEIKYLRGLSKLLGWGDDLIDVWTVASDDEKRKLVIGAIAFWQCRWLESGMELAVRLVTGNRYKDRNYFDFRWVLGENVIMEEMQNSDCILLSLAMFDFWREYTDGSVPGPGDPRIFNSATAAFTSIDEGGFIVIQELGSSLNGIYEILEVLSGTQVRVNRDFSEAGTSLDFFIAFRFDEYLTEIRIVDDEAGQGAVNRDLFHKLLELQRPSSERFNVVYLTFMDLFTTAFDLGQWDSLATSLGMMVPTVHDGVLDMTGHSGHMPVDYYDDDNWEDFTFTTKASFQTDGGLDIMFCYQDEDNHYKFQIERAGFGTGIARLLKNVSGTESQIGSDYAFPSLALDAYWSYRIHCHVLSGGDTSIKTEIDGDVVFDETDSAFDKGKIGFGLWSPLLVHAQYNDVSGQVMDLDYVRDGNAGTASETGDPDIIAESQIGTGALELTGVAHERVEYTGAGLVDAMVQKWAVELFIRPQYSGAPATIQYLFTVCNSSGSNNNGVMIYHDLAGELYGHIFDSSGVSKVQILAPFNPTADDLYHIVLVCDADMGQHRMFLGGGQHGSTDYTTFTRSANAQLLRVGGNTVGSVLINDVVIPEFVIWGTNKWRADFTPRIAELTTQEDTTIYIDETELWRYPTDIVRVGPNP